MAGFDPTLGGSAANSYQSLRMPTFFAYSPYQTQWDAFEGAQKHTALIQATFWLETLDWAGDVARRQRMMQRYLRHWHGHGLGRRAMASRPPARLSQRRLSRRNVCWP